MKGPLVLGVCEPARGWFSMSYEERRVNLLAATSAIATAAAGSSSGLLLRPQAAAPLRAATSPLAQYEEEEESVVLGEYSAAVLVPLPDVAAFLSGGGEEAVFPSVPQALLEGEAALHRGQGVCEGGSGEGEEAVRRLLRDAPPYASLLSAASGEVGAAPTPITLSSRISFNFGAEWLSCGPGTVVSALRPALSHSSPTLLPLLPILQQSPADGGAAAAAAASAQLFTLHGVNLGVLDKPRVRVCVVVAAEAGGEEEREVGWVSAEVEKGGVACIFPVPAPMLRAAFRAAAPSFAAAMEAAAVAAATVAAAAAAASAVAAAAAAVEAAAEAAQAHDAAALPPPSHAAAAAPPTSKHAAPHAAPHAAASHAAAVHGAAPHAAAPHGAAPHHDAPPAPVPHAEGAAPPPLPHPHPHAPPPNTPIGFFTLSFALEAAPGQFLTPAAPLRCVFWAGGVVPAEDSIVSLEGGEEGKILSFSLASPTFPCFDGFTTGAQPTQSWLAPTLLAGGTARSGLLPTLLQLSASPVNAASSSSSGGGGGGGGGVDMHALHAPALIPLPHTLSFDLRTLSANCASLAPGRYTFSLSLVGAPPPPPLLHLPFIGTALFFQSSSLTVSTVGLGGASKKFVPGAECVAEVPELAATFALPPPPPPPAAAAATPSKGGAPAATPAKGGKPAAAPPPTTAAKGAAAAAAAKGSAAATPVKGHTPAPSAPPSPPRPPLPPMPPDAAHVCVKVAWGGAAAGEAVVQGVITNGGAGVAFSLPAGDHGGALAAAGDGQVSVSMDGGKSFSKACAIKVLKK